jgi:hypothetical protein
MEIGPIKAAGVQQQPVGVTPVLPGRDKSYLVDRMSLSSDKDNTWRDQADQLNQLAQMARMRGFR